MSRKAPALDQPRGFFARELEGTKLSRPESDVWDRYAPVLAPPALASPFEVVVSTHFTQPIRHTYTLA